MHGKGKILRDKSGEGRKDDKRRRKKREKRKNI